MSFFHALTPPVTHAAISDQLESAKKILVEGRIVGLSTLADSTRTLLVDLWYLWAMVLDGAVCAQLVHWGLGILLVLATVVLATPLLGRRWAWLAGSLVVLTPAVNQQMSLPAESVALAAFCILGLAAWSQAVVHGADRGWFLIAGLTAGGALGIHASAALLLVLAVAMHGAWTAWHRVEQRRFLLHGGTIAAIIALGVGIPCNLPSIWRAAMELRETTVSACLCDAILIGSNTSLATLPKYIGVILLAAVPGVLLARRLRGLGILLWAALAYGVFIVLWGADRRLLFPVIPLLSVAIIWVWIELRRFPHPARRIAVGTLALALACNITMSLERLPDAFRVACGWEDREEYLLRHEPTYRAASVVNPMFRADDHLLSQAPQAFYFNCRVTRVDSLRPSTEGMNIGDTVQRLRHEGFTHLLLTEQTTADSTLQRVADAAVPLTDYQFRTADGSSHRYRLVSLR